MVKKKFKPGRTSKKRVGSWHVEDVQVSTGLPPQVEGQLRCFCQLSVNQVTWDVPNTPDVTYVRIKWWGEPGEGAIFRPVDVKRGNATQAKTTARYPVRSGPKQFASYLSDMGSLIVEILSGTMMVSIGTAEIPHLGQLSPTRSIIGFFPIISPTEEKIGDLHVALVIESLMASYDSTGSIPTTDISMETYTSHVTQESAYPKRNQPVPHSEQPRKPVEDPFISPASHQNGESHAVNGYVEDLRQRLNYEPDPVQRHYLPKDSGSTVAITTNGDIIRTDNLHSEMDQSNDESSQQVHSSTGRDLLSVLLNKGNKLREEMIISALDSKAKTEPGGQTSETEPKHIHEPTEIDEPNLSLRSSNGSFLKEILKEEKIAMGTTNGMEDRALDLVLGDDLDTDLLMYNNLVGSPHSSISNDDLGSDPGDPIHSESILNELFYKQVASADELSDLSCDEKTTKKHKDLDDPTNLRPPSRSSSLSSLNLAFPEPEKKKLKPVKTPKRKSRLKLRRKGSKKRRGSKSRSQGSASDVSDSEALSTASTPRSESSRVSFDMVPSDIDEPPSKEHAVSKKTATDGLSVERLTLLGRVHVARVTIENLQLSAQDMDTSSSKLKRTKYGMKPPKPSPKTKKQSTYFIEYQFPVVATSRDKYSPNAMATEVMRVVSRNVKNNLVGFNHRSVFPIMFDGNAIERWWKSALIFKVFSRKAGQKVGLDKGTGAQYIIIGLDKSGYQPSLIGSCGIPLKSILKSESLYVSRDMEVRQSLNAKNTSINDSRQSADGLIGALKVVIELASDSKEFPTALAKTKLAEMTGKAKIVPIPQAPPSPKLAPKPPLAPVITQRVGIDQPAQGAPRGIEGRPRSKERTESRNLAPPVPVSIQEYEGDQCIYQMPSVTNREPETLTLHTLLMIPDGRDISMQGVPSLMVAKRRPIFPHQPTAHAAPGVRARDMSVRNSYLVCRMFWCDESVHSAVCWGSSEPQFKFQQIAPVLITQSLLERLKNNFMIVEVWDKKTSADNDKLVGIVKLSLHQFYMSFRDKRICSALLKSQYPVIAVENYLPVVDVFSGSQFGQLNVLLAMGSAEQVAHLVRMKTEGGVAAFPERPQHFLERQDLLNQGDTIPAQIGTESVVEHIFELVIEGVRGLMLFDSMIWGEADCFVQYYFPAQQQSQPPGAPVIRHAVPILKAFRTATTLCIADPTFNDVTRHRILLPVGTPVQRELLTACANSASGAGGLPFEIWCRYYHPNVRDQCIAKGSLPLAKLCAMITMQKRGEPSVQSFNVSLTQVPSDSIDNEREKTKSLESGLIDVTVHYKTQTIQEETSINAANKNLAGAQVCISVGVIRASGLKAAAEKVASLDQGMQYPAEVGVNAYVRVKLSFLGQQGERITRTVARSFSPEFSHFMDFPCPLLWTEANSDALCLAELLETAEATFEVWHQVPGMSPDFDIQWSGVQTDDISARKLIEKTSDVLLGTTTLPLKSLLSHRTGYNGWFPVNIPVRGWSAEETDTSGNQQEETGLNRVGGGIEVSIKFAHHEDRERVIHAARGVGWSPIDIDVEQDGWESEDENSNRYHHINITIDHVNFPLQNALIAGQTTLDKTAQCYVRYKFYDKAAVMTKFSSVSVNDLGYLTSKPHNKHNLQIPDSSTFKWFLREERLEMQVWVSYGSRKGDEQKPKHRDKLIGSAYISLEPLSDERRKQHRVSGMFPLFKPGASSLGGAYLRAHIAAKPQFGKVDQGEGLEGMITLDGEDMDYDPDDSFHQIRSEKPVKQPSPELGPGEQEQALDTSDTFPVLIAVERALHLPLISNKATGEDTFPNTYISYPTAESTIQIYSNVFPGSDNPVWDHEQETRLGREMLFQENKNLVFKVWHKPENAPKHPDKLTDRVLGFVSVDLTPLASGLQQVCGWYNIMDFSGQIKGQIKISVIPQESVSTVEGERETNLPPTSSFLSLPAFGLAPPATSDPMSLPHFQQHYENVKHHHELLQQQLQEHIQQFLRQQEETQGGSNLEPQQSQQQQEPSIYRHEPSIHWQPTIPEMRQEDSSSSRSYLFSSLRRNLQDLDDITNNLKSRLRVTPVEPSSQSIPQQMESQPLSEYDIPVTSHYPLTSTQSTISTSQEGIRSQRDTPRDDLALTGSHGGESARTMGDSGAYSVERSDEKYDSAPDSQRSCSDRLDTFRYGNTPRDFVATLGSDSGIINTNNISNNDDLSLNMASSLTPRASAEVEDRYAQSGGFSYKSNGDTFHSPRDYRPSPRDINGISSYERLTPRGNGSQNGEVVSQNEDKNTNAVSEMEVEKLSKNQKQMSVIEEFPENDRSDSEDESPRYYHQYRDMLDSKDDDDDDDDKSEAESEDGEIVVPKRLNDTSGKYSPTGEIIMLCENNHSVPYTRTPSESLVSPKPVQNHIHDNEQSNNIEAEDDDITPRVSNPERILEDKIQFNEKDSWLLDSDKEEEENDILADIGRYNTQRKDSDTGYNDVLADIGRYKPQRQDSDTGYRSGDISESLHPDALGTNSESDMSHLHDYRHADIKFSAIDDISNPRRLLSNVELESTSGSGPMKLGSRISTTDSRHFQRSLSNRSDEKSDIEFHRSLSNNSSERSDKDVDTGNFNLNVEDDNVVSNVHPLSARSEELEDFFSTKQKQLSLSQSSKESETGSPRFRDKDSKTVSQTATPRYKNSDAENEQLLNGFADEEESEMADTVKDISRQNMPNFFMPVQHLEESIRTLQLLTRFHEVEYSKLTPEDLKEKCTAFLSDFKPTEIQLTNLEKMTRSQSESVLWKRHREGRITATIAHDIKTMKSESTDCILKRVMKYDQKDLSKVEAISFGLFNERRAKELYSAKMKTEHADFQLRDSGLVIDPVCPIFAASPDGVRNCICHGKGLLEVKCSFKHRDLNVSEIALIDPTFYLDRDLRIKQSHRYYTQIQFQMYVCQLTFCDFVVFTLKGISIHTVAYNPKFVNELVQKCSEFAFNRVVPEILCHKLSSQESETNICVCKRPSFGKIVSCSKPDCEIKMYHLSCANLQRKPRGPWTCLKCSH